VSYTEFPAPEDLSAVVDCTWERHGSPGERPDVLVLPDGCADLIWRGAELRLAGPDSEAFTSPVAPGESIAAIRFRPGWAGAALGWRMADLRGVRTPLADVWGADAAVLAERLALASGAAEQRALLEAEVRGRLSRVELPDRVVPAAVGRLGLPGSRVGSLSDELGISERQLRRRFDDAVGYGPKTLDRVLRFRRFVERADGVAGGSEDLARLAAELGYADQAHLSRDSVRLSGMPPAALARSRTA
jgi:AraC-like DNA-binding protein